MLDCDYHTGSTHQILSMPFEEIQTLSLIFIDISIRRQVEQESIQKGYNVNPNVLQRLNLALFELSFRFQLNDF